MKNKSDIENKMNEEFGIEFGDVNGVKLYELPLMNKKKMEKNSKKKK